LSSDKRTVWIQAVVLILLAAMGYVLVAAYARHYPNAEALLGDGEATTQPVAIGPPGAPTREEVGRLHDSLRKQFGVNARGLPRVAHVDYDGWPDRLHVIFALDHVPGTMTTAQASELRPLLDVLQAVHAGGLRWRWILITGTAPIEGRSGRVTESTAVRAQFAREKLDRVDWSRVKVAELEAMAEQFAVDPALADVRGPSTKPVGARRVEESGPLLGSEPGVEGDAPVTEAPDIEAPSSDVPPNDGSVIDATEVEVPEA
jgi:hypothetical protein